MVKHLESGELTGAPKEVGRTLTAEDREFYEQIIHRTLEVIQMCRMGLIKPSEHREQILELDPDSTIPDIESIMGKKPKGKIITTLK
jgi:hypothetical protein